MKNLLGAGLAILLVLTLAIPAMAKLDIGGAVIADAYYYQQDKEGFAHDPSDLNSRTTPGSGGMAGLPDGYETDEDDRSATYLDLNHASHFRFLWTSKHGVGMFFTPYMNGDPTQSGQSSDNSGYKHGFRVGISNVVGYWDITPKLRIIAGKGGYETIFTPDDPDTSMGYDGIAHVKGLGYGNINSNYQNGVRFTYKFTPKISLKMGFLESRLTDNKSPNEMLDSFLRVQYLPDSGVPGGYTLNPYYTDLTNTGYHDKPLLKEDGDAAADNVTVLPKIEMALPMIFKGSEMMLRVTPSLMYLEQKFDNIAPGADDTILSYGYSLGMEFQVSKFTFRSEVNMGQNFKNASRIGTAQCYPFKAEYTRIANIQSARADEDGKVHDSETLAYWAEINYRIGKFRPALFYGNQTVKRDLPANTGSVLPNWNSDVTTQFYGFNCKIFFVDNFYLKPEFMIYDNGDGDVLGVHYEFGKEMVAGTQLVWIF